MSSNDRETAQSGAGEGFGEPFDQTNGMVEGLEGDSDGTAEGEQSSAADRGEGGDDTVGAPLIPPAGHPTSTP